MAITKIHPIKVNLKKALDYIENPDKTDDKMFVSSYGCSYETADIEFQMLLDQAFKKGNNLAHHLIQSFEPRETALEQGHELGRQLADEILGGKYEYVIATHINKEHCHNHIIFCAVDFAEHKKSTFPTAKAMRRSAMSATGCAEKMGCSLLRPARSAASSTLNGTRSGKGQAISKS